MISGTQQHTIGNKKGNLIKLLREDNIQYLNGLLPTLNFPLEPEENLFAHEDNGLSLISQSQ